MSAVYSLSTHARERIDQRIGGMTSAELIDHLAVAWEASDAGMTLFKRKRCRGFSYQLCLVKGTLTMFVITPDLTIATVITTNDL